MPFKGGKKKKRFKKNNLNDFKRPLLFKEEGQEYAKVTKLLGGCWLSAICHDNKIRLCHIRGKMRKRDWIEVGDIVLIGLREFENDRADIVHKYKVDEVNTLKSLKKLNVENFGIEAKHKEEKNDDGFDFGTEATKDYSDLFNTDNMESNNVEDGGVDNELCDSDVSGGFLNPREHENDNDFDFLN